MKLYKDSPVVSILASLGLLGSILLSSNALADGGSDAFRASLEKWVQARTLLSKERSDWLVERQYLESTRDLLKDERDALREQIAALEASQSGTDEERRNLVLARGDYQQTSLRLAERIAGLERRVTHLIPKLPVPLTDRLEPLLVQIPEDPAQSKVALGQRLMNVLGVLSQAEKWNSTATLVGETRSLSDEAGAGQKMQVRTLYWGLGQAIYVDAQGEVAGIGRPTESGWTFENDVELASEARLLLDIYEGNVDTIAFVPIPVKIQ